MPRLSAAIFAVLAALAFPAGAQEWTPSKPVKIVVPLAGGTVDILARLVAPHLQEAFGQPVIVENKAGAGGNIGTDLVAKADPDGTTILCGYTGPITVNQTLFGNLPYDPQKDLAPIMLAVTTPQFLTVNPSVPFSTVDELVKYAKANPGKLSYGSIGIGAASHLTMEMFKSAAGINLVHVPYKGPAPAVADLLAGNVQLAFLVPGNVLPHLASGKLKVLASSGRTRFRATPQTPTMIELGYPDFEAIAWIGFLAPGATPKPVIERYHRELVRILNIPEVNKRLTDIQFDVVASTPEQFAEYIRWETPRWAAVIKQTGAKATQ